MGTPVVRPAGAAAGGVDAVTCGLFVRGDVARGELVGFGLRLLGGRLFSFEILRQLEGRAGAFFHGALHRLLVSAQGFLLDGLTEVARFDVEEKLYLPRLERVTVHGAAYQILQELVETV